MRSSRLRLAISIRATLQGVLGDRGQFDAAARVHRRHIELVESLERRVATGAVTDAETLSGIASGYSNAGIYRAGEPRPPGRARLLRARDTDLREASRGGLVQSGNVRAYSLTLKRLGAVEMVTGATEASERHYRAALALEEDAISPLSRRSRLAVRNVAHAL